MKELFKEHNTEVYMEKIEIILDRAKSEKNAKSNVVDFYLILSEDEGINLDVNEIISLAESYGYDFSDFDEILEKNK